ncbi:hypothetical protein MKW98_030132 [Papaver atlanticum]|uniref:Uncharacterized protein n=1 Tax=Papaver atlanticum TaxID=357466 RepID=A0AAD4T7C3_9MAGN|nr:hypothetical protein MKW98_030132 [Papaver atlanticum]
MSFLSNGKYNQGSGKIPTSKAVQDSDDYRRPRKIHRTSCSITNLPSDCLNLIFKCLETRGDHTKTRDDRNSFGLTCRQWLHIQNNNHESLWYDNNFGPGKYPKISPKCFTKVLSKLLVRFQHLKYLSLKRCPGITDYITLKSQYFGSKVQHLELDCWHEYSNIELSIVFSWFPRLTNISLKHTQITDKGLDALAKYCSSLETVDLTNCQSSTDKDLEALAKSCSSLKHVTLSGCRSITDSGLNVLLQNCRELVSLCIYSCSKITGIGFSECPKTLTYLGAQRCKLKPEGIKAIISGEGLEYLSLSALGPINTDTVVTISKGCPYLKHLKLDGCEEVELEGWEAIGRNCKHLESLQVYQCEKLCDLGLQALCNGCSKLSRFVVDCDNNSFSRSALDLYMRKKPGVIKLVYEED